MQPPMRLALLAAAPIRRIAIALEDADNAWQRTSASYGRASIRE